MGKSVIELKNLCLGYGEKTIVQDVNFGLKEGELVGIIGCNGAGKSTLLKSIRGFLPIKSGEIDCYGKPLNSYNEKELALKIAYLQQQVQVNFDYSCLEVVMAGRYPHKKWWQEENDNDEKIALACLEYTGTLDLADRNFNQLSGGQRQRVLIAKILAQQSPIIFLDEPTTGLDLVYQEEIFRFARDLADNGKAVMMVVHELNLAARYCNRVLLIGNGRILACGSPEEVFTEENLSAAYGTHIAVNRNERTGNLDISVDFSNEQINNKKNLLNCILND